METWLIDVYAHIPSKTLFAYGLGESTTTPTAGLLLTVNSVHCKTPQQAYEATVTCPKGYVSGGCLKLLPEKEGWQILHYKVGPVANMLEQDALTLVRCKGGSCPANLPLMFSRGGTTLVGAPFTDFSVATAAQVTTAMAYTRDPATLPSKEEARVLRGTHIQALTSVLEQVVRHGGILPTPPPYYEEPAPMQDFILTEFRSTTKARCPASTRPSSLL